MLRQIKYFQSVVHNNSFSEAAEEYHISQSAISQQIKALENEQGFSLLGRKNIPCILVAFEEQQTIVKTMSDAGFDVVPVQMDLSSRATALL